MMLDPVKCIDAPTGFLLCDNLIRLSLNAWIKSKRGN